MKKILVVVFAFMAIPFLGQDHVQRELLIQLVKDTDPNEIVLSVNKEFGSFLNFHWEENVSNPMRIHLFQWDWAEVNEMEVLRYCQLLPQVQVAQFNHLIEDRLTPNDPIFGNQWHHIDPQDNDIDSELAWDITTGGLTPMGDEIVACVVETQGANGIRKIYFPTIG